MATQENRPSVMENLSETQLQELEFQFDEGDRQEFDEMAGTFGWDTDVIESVWTWFESGKQSTTAGGDQG
jgi:hypothetical protein